MPDMATPGTKPTSALLQDMLREKKAQSQRAKKTCDPANGQKNALDDREIQSSPIAAMSPRDRLDAHSRRDSGVGIRKEMGLKEMQEHISKMSKQNFNLKLEVHYCRERNKALETKLENFKELEADNRELQSINEEMMSELETRIVAVEQAVDVICEREATIEELEAKNKELEMAVVRMDFSRSPDLSDAEPAKEGTEVIASNLSTVTGTELSDSSRNTGIGVHTDQQPLSEHSLSAPDTLSPPKPSARRIPSFMRDNKKSTTVLRSLYSSGNPSFVSLGRPISMLSGDDDDDRQMSNSPTLSILSESGFESIYGGRKDQTSDDTDGEDNVAEPQLPSNPPQRDAQSQLRLRRWLDEKNMTRTPSPKGTADDRVSSIGEVLSQAQTPQDRNTTAVKVPDYPREQRTPEKRQGKQARSHEKRSSSPSFAGPIFGAAILPPTPDTMSTATLNANSSTASIITEKSLLDYPTKARSALLLDTRPQSSQSGNGSPTAGSLRDTARPSMSAQSHTRGISGSDTAKRPSLTISGTDTFSGGSLSTTQASRTLSYPSPTSRTRRFSGQRSPQSYRGSDSNSDKTVDQSPQERLRSGSGATIMPRRTAKDDHRSPLSPQEETAPSPITALPHFAASPPRASSLRSKIVSRFSRSSANNATRIPNPSSNLNDTTPSRPPVTRAPASTQHARLPRPASLYGQDPDFNFSPSPTYELKSMIPDEEDMLTSLERYSAGSARNVERGRDRVRK